MLALDTAYLTANGSPNTILGTPFTASVVNGVAKFDISGDLAIPEGDSIVVTADRPLDLVIDGNLDLPGGSLLDCAAGSLTIDATGSVDLAGSVAVDGSFSVDGQTVINSGSVDVDGANGGTIEINAANFQNSGPITADGTNGAGGSVRVAFTDSYVETTSGLITANGADGPGGSVTVDGGTSAHLFTSGLQEATGSSGGAVQLLAGTIDVIGGTENASGSTGAGGRVTVIAKGDEQYFGTLIAQGETAGGQIEASAGGTLTYGGSADAGASAGPAGSLTLDPTNLVISNAPAGAFPQFNLLDPNSAANDASKDGSNDGFGELTAVLPNGNVVVGTNNQNNVVSTLAGDVYLFDGHTGALISSLVGQKAGDEVGNLGVTVLPDGNFLILSPAWSGGEGAVTWASQTAGVSGFISAANSLVGSHVGDYIGSNAPIDFGGGNIQYPGADIQILSNGNYVIESPTWNGSEGAVTWGNESTGISAVVSSLNSLVGTSPQYQGYPYVSTVEALTNGNFIVKNPGWNGGQGAVTWGSGTAGISGGISSFNSLVGSTAGDLVGSGIVALLTNGNYVVDSPNWSGGRGAVTWGSGTSGVGETIASGNSLVGSSTSDQVGSAGVAALTNGNYVVASPNWSSGLGAITWGNGTVGVTGGISSANSIVGSTAGDQVGSGGVTPLSNGNYVIASPTWDGYLGAATWESGTGSVNGQVTKANSLYGTTYDTVEALANGNYVVLSPGWNNSLGAVTWGNGTTGTTGAVSSSNSLVGSTPASGLTYGDSVGEYFQSLPNGNFLVASIDWQGGKGELTWESGSNFVPGVVSSTNSIVGSEDGDDVGDLEYDLTILSNGNFVLRDPSWKNNTGAITWGSGTSGVAGVIGPNNSLIGAKSGDFFSNVTALTNGNYVVNAPEGATWANGSTGVKGTLPLATTFGTGSAEALVNGNFTTALADGNFIVNTTSSNGLSALTWVNGATGQTLDGTTAVDAQNSLIQPSGFVSLGTAEADPALDGFIVPFIPGSGATDGGLIEVGFLDPNQITYGLDQGNTLTITPGFLTRTLDTGTAVVLQANNDITVNSAITASVSGGGKGGALTLAAGRSVLVNASITTANGNLTLIANDTAADGVVISDRGAGAANITVASGTTLNVGTGTLTLDMATGSGVTTTAPGAVTLTGVSVTAGSIVSSTVTTLTDNGPSPSAVGKPASFSVTVTPSYGSTAINGATIQIEDTSNNNAVVATPTLSNGTASFNLSSLSFGTHSLVAVYGGAATLLASQSLPVGQSIEYGTSTMLTANGPNPSPIGTPASFTVTVTPNGGNPVGGETVKIEDASNNNAVLTTTTLENGTLTFSLSNLPVGVHELFAVYAGDATDLGSQSGTVSQGVDQVTKTPTSQAVNPAQSATFTAGTNQANEPVLWKVSTNGGTTFQPITQGGPYSDPTQDTLTITAPPPSFSGFEYEAFFDPSSPQPIPSGPAILTVDAVGTQPTSQAYGGTVQFTATSLSNNPAGSDTVQWRVSADGGNTFQPIQNGGEFSGVTTDTLTISGPTTDMTADEFAAFFTNASGTFASNGANIIAPTIYNSDNGITAASAPEDAPTGTPVGINIATFLNGGVGITYSLLDSAGGRFAVDPNSGIVTVADGGSLLNALTVPTYRITVQAADAVGQSVSAVFSIAVVDQAPSVPVDTDATHNSVAEHAASGTTVGITATATDLNAVTYSLTNNDGGIFAIDLNTGIVSVANGSSLSYTTSPTETITVKASDSDGGMSSASFTINVTSATPGSLVIDGISLINPVVTGSNVSGSANLPLAGMVTLSGTVQGNQYDLTTPALGNFNVDGVTLRNAVYTLTSDSLTLTASATLPLFGTVTLSGSIASPSDFSLGITSTLPQLGGLTLTDPTIIPVAAGIGFTTTVSLAPVLNDVTLTGTIQTSGAYSLTTSPETYTVDGYGLSDGVVTVAGSTLSNGTVTLSGTVTLPVVGNVNLTGTELNGQFTLSTSPLAISIGTGFGLTGAVVTLAPGGISLSGNINLPVVGSATIAGTIQDALHYSLMASLANFTLGGITLSSPVATINATGLSFSAGATLPLVNNVHISGTIQDASDFSLSVTIGSFGGLAFPLTGTVVTLNNEGIVLSGTVPSLPLAGSNIALSGLILDASHYSVSATLPSVAIGGFTLTGVRITLSDAGLSFLGNATLPVIGSIMNLQGVVQSANDFSLSVPVPSVTIGSFTLSSNTVTLADSGSGIGLTLTGNTNPLPVFGVVQFTGSIGADGTLGLSASLPSFSLADGLATFQNDTLTLFTDHIQVDTDVTIAHVATAHFSGEMDASGNYEFDAYVSSLTIAGFTIPVPNTGTPDLTLKNGVLDVGFDYDIPGLSSFLPPDEDSDSVSFGGTYSLSGGWSLTAKATITFDIGPVVVTQESLTLTDESLKLTASGSILDLGPLAAGQVIMTIYNDLTFAASVNLSSTIAGFSLGTAAVTFGDHNPGDTFIAQLQAKTTVPTGPTITLDGYWNSNGLYDFKGTGSYTLGPFSLASAQFDMSDLNGPASFTFIAGVNLFSVLQGKISGTIVETSGSGFSVTSMLAAGIAGGPSVNFSGSFDSQGDYSFTGHQNLNVGPLSLEQTTFTLSNTIGGLMYSDSWDYGIYSATVSGTFAADGKGFVVTADAKGTFLGQSLELQGNIHSSGAYTLTGKANVSVGPVTVSQALFTLNNTSGFQFSDSWKYLVFAGNIAVTISPDSQDPFEVNASLSVVGSTLNLVGDITTDGSSYSLTASTAISVGPITLATADFTLNNSGFSFSSNWHVLVFAGAINASISSNSQGYVITVAPSSYLSVLGSTLNLSGVVSASGQDTLTGATSIWIGPFNLLSANFTLNDSGLSLDASWNYLVFKGNVDASFGTDSQGLYVTVAQTTYLSVFGESLDLSGVFHIGGTFSLTGSTGFTVGPLNLGSASFTLNDSGLSFTAGWNFLVFSGGVSASIGYNSQGFVIVVNSASTYLSVFGPKLSFGGYIEQSGPFDLYGSTTIAVAGLTLASANFTLSNAHATELTFNANWNFVFFSGTVGGSIDSNGTVNFSSSAGTAKVAGFTLSVTASAILDTKDSNYSLTLSSTAAVLVANVNFSAHATWSTGGPQVTLQGTAAIGGNLADILEGSATFTINAGASTIGFSGTLSVPGVPGASLNVNASIDGAGDLTGIPGLPSLSDLFNLLVTGGATLCNEVANAWNKLGSTTTDLAQGLNQLLPGDATDIVGSLQNIFGASQVTGIIDAAFPSQASDFLNSASGVIGSVGGGISKAWKSVGGETEGGLVFFDPSPFTGVLASSDPQGFTLPTGGFTLYVPTSYDTNNNGAIDDSEGRIIVQGGVDLSTGLPEVMSFVAPGGWSIADVFSTIVAALYYQHNSVPDATATSQVLLAMALPAQVSLSTYDATQATLAGDSNGPKVLSAQAKLEDTIAMVAALFRSPSSQPASSSLTATVAGDIASEVAAAGSAINFSSAATITTLIQAAESSTSITLNSSLVAGAAGVIAALNQQLDALSPTANLTFIHEVAKIQQVAESTVSNDLASAAAGLTSISTVTTNDTGSGLAARVAAAVTLPTIIVSPNITVAATSAAGAAEHFNVSAYDLAGESLTPTLSANSGATFPIGSTIVTSTATDSLGDTTSTSFTVTVVDSTPPSISLPTNMVFEANSTGGANLTLPQASATDPVDPHPTVSESIASGFFPLGATSVVVTATDAAGNVSTGVFTVTVEDTTAPTLTVPANLVVEANITNGAMVTLPQANAVDSADPSPVVIEDQTSGFFALGTTTVHVTATDASGNVSTGSFTVTVQDTTPPTIILPANFVVEATTTGGAQVTLPPVTATDVDDANPQVSEDHTSGFFPLGVTTVHVTATDASGNSSTASYTVTVQDTTPPTINLPANLIVQANTIGGATVTLPQVTATDIAHSNPTVTEDQTSGFFALGTTIVHVTATDASGNSSTGTYTVTVQDTTAPVLTLPANVVVQANTTGGADVILPQGTAIDVADPNPVVTEDQTSGFFTLGTTIVHVAATDASGNVSNGSFTVTVQDTAPPVLTLPLNVIVQATQQGGGTDVTLPQAIATDIADPNPTITYSQVSGFFPEGVTTVNVRATDVAGNVATGSFTVTVANTIPPTITDPTSPIVQASAAGGAMVTLPGATVTDLVDPSITYSPPSGFFPVGTTLVTVTAIDTDGNRSISTFTVTVDPAGTNLSLVDNGPTSSTYGQSVTFTATLTSTIGATIPDGESVSLEDASNGNAVVATGTLEHGRATIVVANLGAGSHSLFAVYTGDATNGSSQSGDVTQSVAKRSLLIEAQPNTKGYDGTTAAAAVPAVIGLQGSDAATGLSETYASSAIGTGIVLTPAGTVADAGNYNISYVNNNSGIITPALIVTPESGQSMIYGSAVPSIVATVSGFNNGDTAAIVTGRAGTTATSVSDAGQYQFTVDTLFANGNYTLRVASGSPTFTVEQATPVISVNGPVSIPIGTPLSNGQLSGTASWIVNGVNETVPGTFSYTSAAGDVLGPGNGQTESVTFTPAPSFAKDFTSATTNVKVNVIPTPTPTPTPSPTPTPTPTPSPTPTPTPSPTPTPTPAPVPLVTVQSAGVEMIKVGTGKKAKKVQVLVVRFSGGVNAGSAENTGAYELAPTIKVKASGKGKNRKPATTRLGSPVPVASAAYLNNQVTLTPRVKLTESKPEELIVNGAFITDILGRGVDGADDGVPGSDYIATVTGTRVTNGGIPLVRAEHSPISIAQVVDHLLAQGGMGELRRPAMK